jgi:hypothetical protein
MEQLDAIVDDLKDLENGIVGIDGMTGKQPLIVSPTAAILRDNPRQSDVCSHRGMVAHANCRLCMRIRQQKVWQLAPQRTQRFVQHMRSEIAMLLVSSSASDIKNGKKFQRKTGVQLGVNQLLNLTFTDPFMHTPIELLHTALLGIARYLVAELQSEIRVDGNLTPIQRSAMSAWIEQTDRRDAPIILQQLI